jgi:very-short-patch-repair endonuclease
MQRDPSATPCHRGTLFQPYNRTPATRNRNPNSKKSHGTITSSNKPEFLELLTAFTGTKPLSRRLDEDLLHACVPQQKKRSALPGTTFHTWNHAYEVATSLEFIHCVEPVVAWEQMAAHISEDELVVLADSAMRRDPKLKRARKQDFIMALANDDHFRGRKKCLRALSLIRENTDSSQESRVRLWLEQNGLHDADVNFLIFDPASGRSAHVDLAFHNLHLIVEYDGAYHNDPLQKINDAETRKWLESLGWKVIAINVADLRTLDARERTLKRIYSKVNLSSSFSLAQYG